LRGSPGGQTPRAIRFTILTIARTNKITGVKWDDISFVTRIWTLTSKKKPDKKFRIALSDEALTILYEQIKIRLGEVPSRVTGAGMPLSSATLAILDEQRKMLKGELVFPGARPRKPMSGVTMLHFVHRMGREVTVHGFRTTFNDWCKERTKFPPEVRKMAMDHVVGDPVEEAYSLSDLFEKRRQLADAWARFCTAVPPSEPRATAAQNVAHS
jgi:integrase